MLHRSSGAVLVLLSALFVCSPARADVIGGVNFPGGVSSFADSMESYTPGMVGAYPGTSYQGAFNALGIPNYNSANSCSTQANCTFVSLGDGGSIVLRFVDNKLTGSGTPALDLWVFEIGPDVEDTFVDISKDGTTWHAVGKVFGSTAGINIDAFGWGPTDLFGFVRLTDDTNEGDQGGITVGADIDAVGAITTVATPQVPEPASLLLLGTGLVGALRAARRRRG